MKRYRDKRYNGDCDSMFSSYDSSEPMSFGSVPIDMEDDYGKNTGRHVVRPNKINGYSNFPHCAEESEAYYLGKIYKI
jgi:hypothetical protein